MVLAVVDLGIFIMRVVGLPPYVKAVKANTMNEDTTMLLSIVAVGGWLQQGALNVVCDGRQLSC